MTMSAARMISSFTFVLAMASMSMYAMAITSTTSRTNVVSWWW
jgi:hypothetical protein